MSRQALAAALVCFLSLICEVASSAQAQVPSQRVSPVTSSERIDGLLAVQKSRSSKFEALRDERTNTLRLIETKTQRLRVLDVELAQARDDATSKRSLGLSNATETSAESERSLGRMRFEVQRILKERAAVEGRLTAKRDFLKKSPGLVDIENDKDVVELSERLRKLDDDRNLGEFRIKEIEADLAAEVSNVQNRQKAEKEERDAVRLRIEAKVNERDLLQTEVRNLGYDLDVINTRALRLIEESDADGNFRTWNSAIFSALVGFVIAGFFYIASSDDRVRYTIFANDSGIQFITLFSIVIAVILFGIIGVLEGKELSALLGGLSGYILGRHAATPTVQAPRSDLDGGPAAKPVAPSGGGDPAVPAPAPAAAP